MSEVIGCNPPHGHCSLTDNKSPGPESMARRYHASSYRPAPKWLKINSFILKALKPHAVSVLASTPFYATHDLTPPKNLKRRRLSAEERDALERIAAVLTIAAVEAHATPPGIVKAWLEKIAREPELFWSAQYPPEAHDLIAAHYARTNEKPGLHVNDLLRGRRIRFSSRRRKAASLNISRAARKASKALARKTGRRRNAANGVLAERLAPVFFSFGGRLARRQIRKAQGERSQKFFQVGAFYRFTRQVIGPLNAHLRQHALPPASAIKIEAMAAKHFNPR